MPAPRLLVMEGNTANGRALLKAAGGDAPSDRLRQPFARAAVPTAVVDICFPADPGANLPDTGGARKL